MPEHQFTLLLLSTICCISVAFESSQHGCMGFAKEDQLSSSQAEICGRRR